MYDGEEVVGRGRARLSESEQFVGHGRPLSLRGRGGGCVVLSDQHTQGLVIDAGYGERWGTERREESGRRASGESAVGVNVFSQV